MKNFEVWITRGFAEDRLVFSGTVSEICNHFIQVIEDLGAEDIDEEEKDCMLSMLEEIAESDDAIFLQWYLDGTVAWFLLVAGTYEVVNDEYSLYGSKAVKQFVYA